jgi:hypothetical protein
MAEKMMKKEDPKNWKELKNQRLQQLYDTRVTLKGEDDPTAFARARYNIDVYRDAWLRPTTAYHEPSHVSDKDLKWYRGFFNPMANMFDPAESRFVDTYTGRLIPRSSTRLMNKITQRFEDKTANTPYKLEIRNMERDKFFIQQMINQEGSKNLHSLYKNNPIVKKYIDQSNFIKYPDLKNSYKIINNLNKKINSRFEDIKYWSKPTELRARLNAIRGIATKRRIYNPYVEPVTPKIMDDLIDNLINNKHSKIKKSNPIQQLLNIMPKEKLIHLLNTVSDASDEIKDIQYDELITDVTHAKHGGLKKLKKRKPKIY